MLTQTTVVRSWAAGVVPASSQADALREGPGAGTAQLPLITRTGFEFRHIVTSQIGSL